MNKQVHVESDGTVLTVCGETSAVMGVFMITKYIAQGWACPVNKCTPHQQICIHSFILKFMFIVKSKHSPKRPDGFVGCIISIGWYRRANAVVIDFF